MLHPVTWCPEWHGTFRTVKGVFASVSSHMNRSLTRCPEWHVAFTTFTGFLSSVNSHMYVRSLNQTTWMTWNILHIERVFLQCELSCVASVRMSVRMTLNIWNNWRVFLRYELLYAASDWITVRMTWNILNNWKASLLCEISCWFRLDSYVNDLEHFEQLTGFSPV